MLQLNSEQRKLLCDFGCQCYWYGEETGNYGMYETEEMKKILDRFWTEFSKTINFAHLANEEKS